MPTPHYAWVTPTVGASDGAWGQILNDAFGEVDSDLFSIETIASAALPKSGGTMTGNLGVKTATLARSDLGAVNGAVALNATAFQSFTMTIAGAVTLSVTNPPGGTVTFALLLRITNGGANVTFPASFKWAGAATPSLSAAATDVVVAISHDNGASYEAAIVKGFA